MTVTDGHSRPTSTKTLGRGTGGDVSAVSSNYSFLHIGMYCTHTNHFKIVDLVTQFRCGKLHLDSRLKMTTVH